MNLLEDWVKTPMAGALGWALVHSLWEGALVAACLMLVLAIARTSRVRYLAACAALGTMLGCFIITLIYVLPVHLAGPPSNRASVFPIWRAVAEFGASGLRQPSLATVVPWLAPLWLAGVCVFSISHIAGWVSVSRLRRRGVCLAPARWQSELARMAMELRLSRPARLLESCLAETPMVVGHFRPIILMPVGLLTGLPAAQIDAILLHELAHIRRCDYLVNLWQRLAEGLLFYHPAVWWISRVVRSEREHCCDDMVVALSGDAREYALALAALEENRWPSREAAMAATGGNLVKRIRRLLHPKGPNGTWASCSAALVLVISAATLGAWQPNGPGQGTLSAPQLERAPLAKWLNEDVVYLIDDKERAAFMRLASDAERQHFVEQFWLRRDPTPGTPENEFKEEHYRRLRYANDRFKAASGRPGWQTDRGHMYIVYGPPDEIDAHPHGYQGSDPIEMWGYRHVEGVGDNLTLTFVDRSKTGDYRLAPGKR